MIKLVVGLIVLVVVATFGYDGVKVLNANRDVRDAATATANAAAHTIFTTHNVDGGAAAATATAKQHGDVVTKYHYDPAKSLVTVTVSGKTSTLVLHYIDNALTQDITASASRHPS